MEKAKIDRINELARKKKTVGLTEEELRERDELRAQYLKEWRESMQDMLDNTYIQQADGTKVKLQKKQK